MFVLVVYGGLCMVFVRVIPGLYLYKNTYIIFVYLIGFSCVYIPYY
ncbi:hypothetical protein IX296_001991 [Bacteroides pyogenes]|nr:hypothetical protein [Bacteroides pyogenes]MBR8754822.1 hypothetical protein [Bacteroides pyogenes]MBR8809697.1 hypothetical protein [Bacteroides pyogenes]